MAAIREGRKSVLVVVDVQVGVIAEAWQGSRIVANIARAVERARAHDVPVIWVQHSYDDFIHGTPEWQWVPELVPADSEIHIHKHFNSAFEETTLADQLSALGATHIVLCGAATNWCIRATAYGVLERGYDLTLIKDGHTTGDMEPDDGPKIEVALMIDELNIAMTWVSYPGRSNTAVVVNDLVF